MLLLWRIIVVLIAVILLVSAWKVQPPIRRRGQHQLLMMSATVSAKRHKVLIIGSGGRENALAEALSRSPSVYHVYVAPGNAGTSHITPSVSNLATLKGAMDVEGIQQFVQEEQVDLVAIGPEDPLVKGISDKLKALGIPCFGPSAAAARIEGSKAWSKDFMSRHNIPTAHYATFSDLDRAIQYIQQHPLPAVIKASGLAAGKGVSIVKTTEEAIETLDAIMGTRKIFGAEAGAMVVIEESLEGEEVSLMGLCDGQRVVTLPCARDHKRLKENDQGPNTGGMGAIAPVPNLDSLTIQAMQSILETTVQGLAAEGYPYHGLLYGGFMLTKEGPKVLEFNCRFGDPEAQVLFPLMMSEDLYQLMKDCVEGRLKEGAEMVDSSSSSRRHRGQPSKAAATVIAASGGYPGPSPALPVPVQGLEQARALPGVSVVHAGTKFNAEGQVVASGGRVLAVTGTGPTLRLALIKAYAGMSHIHFDGMQVRTDIGQEAVAQEKRPLRVAVLGSTRGTSVRPLLEHQGIDPEGLYEIVLVMSNKAESGLSTCAREKGLLVRHVEVETDILTAVEEAGAEVLLLNGYNRILSPSLVEALKGRCLNLHPALLPEFAGLFDMDVHRAVLEAKRKESGCTVHLVTGKIDQGPPLLQLKCPVEAGDTAEGLRASVQALEPEAWRQAIDLYRYRLSEVAKAILACG